MIKRLLILALIPAMLVHGEVVEQIAIVVNNRAVTLQELKKIYAARAAELYQQFSGDELQEKLINLRQIVIDEKKEEMLLLEKAQLEGITVSDEQIDDFIRQLMEENNIDNIDQFENVLLQSTGMTLAEFKESQRKQSVARTTVQQLVMAKIAVDDAQLRAYYEQHKNKFLTDFSYDIQEIVVFYEEGARADAFSRMLDCKEQLLEDKIGFGEAVQKYSESGSKEYNGELKDLKRGDLNTSLEEAALALKPGGISDIVDTGKSFHILRLTSVSEPEPRPFEEVKYQIESTLTQPRVETAIQKFVEGLENDFYVRVEVKPEDL